MSNNHLVEQIQLYDKNVKEYDSHFVSQDNQLLNVLAGKNAQDEYLNNDELKHLWGQQVRKIINNEVKDREKAIKQSVAKGLVYGQKSRLVDFIMYLSLIFAVYFGYIAFKKLQE